jgi:CDP-glucose 4,6-dehydratase
MEALVNQLAPLRGARLLVTGHSGFKGGWLCAWAQQLGCEVHGLALAPTEAQKPLHSCIAPTLHAEHFADVRDAPTLRRHVEALQPDAIIHLAGQSLLARGMTEPHDTFATNVMGTVAIMEAARLCPSAPILVIATSDKCYHNDSTGRPFAEGDRLGGDEPYSASKAAAELAIAGWRGAYPAFAGRLASGRAGNVIGGGDFSPDRLIPDLFRARAAGEPMRVRAAQATRPWQHVLEPVGAYLLLAARLLKADLSAATAFNFGPAPEYALSVEALLAQFAQQLGDAMPTIAASGEAYAPEVTRLSLDCTLAATRLDWNPRLTPAKMVAMTADWYEAWHNGAPLASLMEAQISHYQSIA